MFLCRLVLVLACILAILPSAGADDEYLWFDLKSKLFRGLNKEQLEMLKRADDPGGAITEDMHRQFWALFSEPDRKDWIEAERSGTPRSETILLREYLNVAFLQSAYETRATGKAARAPDLDALRQQVFSLGPREPDRWQSVFAGQDRWLDPAFEPPPKLLWRYLSRMFESLNEAQVRLWHKKMLLGSAWNDDPRAWFYPPMRLRLTWPYPWWMRKAILCEQDCKAWSILQSVRDIGVGVWFFGGVRPEQDILEYQDIRVAMNLMTDLGSPYTVVEQNSEEAEWRGHRSTKFESSIKQRDGSLSYRVVRIVFGGDATMVWVLGATSSTSLLDAEAGFGRLEEIIELQ